MILASVDGSSIVTTVGSYLTSAIGWVGSVFDVISQNELALFLVCIPVLFTIVKFAKYILGIQLFVKKHIL